MSKTTSEGEVKTKANPGEPREIGRYTLVRRIVLEHLIEMGARAEFISTDVARATHVGGASCNKVFTTLRDAGWITQKEEVGTAKPYRWDVGGIAMARAYCEAYDEDRGN